MSYWQAVVLGLIEGITEYLPISSTGHLILVSALLDINPEQRSANDAFIIISQGGAILAVVLLYWRRIREMAQGVVGKNARGFHLLRMLIVAFLPAAILGALFANTIERELFKPWPVVIALGVGGFVMLFLKARSPTDARTIDQLTWKHALLIGFCQCIAMWPGTSRSMMTMFGAVVVGLTFSEAAIFSFLLGLVTLSSACAYKSLDAYQTHAFSNTDTSVLIVGFVAATLSAFICVRWFVKFLDHHSFKFFGWYRIVLSGLVAGIYWLF